MAGEADIDTRQLKPVGGIAPRGFAEWRNDFLVAAFLGLITFVLYIMPSLLGRAVSETPEARIAVVARQMITSGDYLLPMMGDEVRLKKPPLPYWITAGVARALDSSAGPGHAPSQKIMARAVEVPSALATAFAVFLASFYACVVFSRSAGAICGLLLGLSYMTAHFGFLGYGDTLLMATTTMALCGAAWLVTAPRPGFMSTLVFGIGLGLAVLVKGHVGLFVALLPVLVEVVLRHSFSGRKFMLFLLGLIIAAAIAVPWFVQVEQAHPGALQEMRDEAMEAAKATGHVQNDRWTFYFYQLAGGLLPWTPFVIFGWLFYLGIGRKVEDASETKPQMEMAAANLRFMLIASIGGFIGFYLTPKQQPYYLLPLMPAIAMASSYALSRFKFPGGRAEEGLAWTTIILGLLVAVAVGAAPAWLPEVVRTTGAKEAVEQILNSTGYGVTAPIGIAVLLLSFALARQWVEGRVVTGILVFAAAAYAGLFAMALYWTTKNNSSTALYLEASGLRDELAKAGNVQVYGAGTSDAKLVFYLDHPVKDFRDIANEPVDPTTSRVLVSSRDDIKEIDRRFDVKLGDLIPAGNQEYFVVPLSSGTEWPTVVKAGLEKHQKK